MRTLSVVLVFMLGGASGACDASECEPFTKMIVDCRVADWSKREPAAVASYGEIGDLLEELIEGPEEASTCAAESEFTRSRSCDDACFSAWEKNCAQPLLDTFVDMAAESEPLPVRWGSIAIVYGMYMDVDAPPAHLKTLSQLSARLLAPDESLTTRAITLKMLEFYDIESAEVIDAYLRHFDDPNLFMRGMAFSRFYEVTQCELMNSWDRETEPSIEQMTAVRSWWEQRRASWKGRPR